MDKQRSASGSGWRQRFHQDKKRKIVDSRARNQEFIGMKLAVIEVDPDYEWLAPYFLLLLHDVTFNCYLVEDHLPENQKTSPRLGSERILCK